MSRCFYLIYSGNGLQYNLENMVESLESVKRVCIGMNAKPLDVLNKDDDEFYLRTQTGKIFIKKEQVDDD